MSSRLRILLAAAVVVVALVAAGAWWLLRDDAPARVTLDSAVESVTTTTGPDAPADGIEGTWTVDSETGDFDYESATGTFVGFRIKEELASIGSTEAVGRTGGVSGSITIEGTTLTAATIEADLTGITTNESRRDDKVQGALETEQFPTATFELTDPVDLGATAADGETVSVTATGDLTVHGVTKSVALPLQARLVDGTVVVVGALDITFADYGVETPTSPIVLSLDDHGEVELQVLFTR